MSLPKAPSSQRLGEKGESEIKSRLLGFSLPNKIALDIGIDFYCELVENETPTQTYFAIQAKGTGHIDGSWGQSIPKSTIFYWLNQPFPVFLVVYDESSDICFWSSIEEQRYSLFQKHVDNTNSHSISLTLGKNNILHKERKKNQMFIDKIREDHVSILKWRGIPILKGEGYVKEMPGPPRSKGELLRTKEYLRMNLSSLIPYYIVTNELDTANVCCDFLMKIDISHFNHFYWSGLINFLIGNREKAIVGYKGALEICERDKTWPTEEMKQLKDRIRKELDLAMSLPKNSA